MPCCPKHSFASLLTSVIVRKVAVDYGCLGTSGAHHLRIFVSDILESLYFYNFFFFFTSGVRCFFQLLDVWNYSVAFFINIEM